MVHPEISLGYTIFYVLQSKSCKQRFLYYFEERYSSIPFAAALPAPMARITVAAPVTASPPAYTPSLVVLPVSSSAIIHCLLLTSSPFVVDVIRGFGDVPSDMITA